MMTAVESGSRLLCPREADDPNFLFLVLVYIFFFFSLLFLKKIFCRWNAKEKFCAQMMLHCTWNDAPPPPCGLGSGAGVQTLPSTCVREFLPSSGGQDIRPGHETEMLQLHEEQRWKLKRNGVLVRVSEHEWTVTLHRLQSIVYSPGKGQLVLRSKVQKKTLRVRNKQRARRRSAASGSTSS